MSLTSCPYESIPIGSSVFMDLVDCWCIRCGFEVSPGPYPAVYLGHMTDEFVYHRFRFYPILCCCNCGASLEIWFRRCDHLIRSSR